MIYGFLWNRVYLMVLEKGWNRVYLVILVHGLGLLWHDIRFLSWNDLGFKDGDNVKGLNDPKKR